MRSLAFSTFLVGFVWLGGLRGEAQTQKSMPPMPSQKKDLEPKAAKPATLDQLIAEALKNNPDIGVADAKRREAEAEVVRTRLMVAAKVSALHGEIEAARADASNAELRYANANSLFRKNTISKQELALAHLVYEKLKAELAVKQAMLPYLLGRLAPGRTDSVSIDRVFRDSRKWLDSARDASIGDDEFLRRVFLDFFGRLPTLDEQKMFKNLPEKTRREKWLQTFGPKYNLTPVRNIGSDSIWYTELTHPRMDLKSPLADKLRKALDTPSRMQMAGGTPADIIECLHDKMLVGINVHLRAKSISKNPIDVKLTEPIPTGAILQYLEDELRVTFILREYGIVVVSADEKLPPGAIRVVDWWKHGKAEKTTPAAK